MFDRGTFSFEEKKTVVHNLDPRVKILAIAGLSFVLILGGLWEIATVAVFVFFLTFLGRVPLVRSLLEIKPILILFLFILTVHTFFTPGTSVISAGAVSVTIEGLMTGFRVISRLFFIVTLGIIYSNTTAPEDTRLAVEWFLRPFPVNEKVLAASAGMGIRFLPVLAMEVKRVREAQKSRCIEESNNVIRRLRSIVVPLLVKVISRAKKLSEAMESRFYNPNLRTYSSSLEIVDKDCVFLVILASFLAFLVLF